METYIYVTITDKDCDLLQVRPALPSRKTPHDKQTAIVLTTAKIWSWVPEGLNAKTDGLTDRLSQSNSDSDILIMQAANRRHKKPQKCIYSLYRYRQGSTQEVWES
jgi:hypothetical protein